MQTFESQEIQSTTELLTNRKVRIKGKQKFCKMVSIQFQVHQDHTHLILISNFASNFVIIISKLTNKLKTAQKKYGQGERSQESFHNNVYY
jgi:hypothetical protein